MNRRPGNSVSRENPLPLKCSNAFRAARASIGVFVFLFTVALASGRIVSAHPLPGDDASAKPPAIVFGFVGGFIAHDNPVHGEVQLAARLRKQYSGGVNVETFESYRGKRARRKILSLLDTNHDGTLSPSEKEEARIIIYGHSWGGAESINLANALEKDGIPVLLTVQVDSVSRFGGNDKIIPANVAQAANFYQMDGLVHGEGDIRAANAARTRIIGNFRFEYKKSTLNCAEYPWYDRIFVKPHTQIECDPVVWDRVESLIRANLPQATPSASAK
jgi:hypothetical protein